MSSDLVLHLELEPGRNADAAVAAELLTAWVRLMKEGARAIEPTGELKIELIGIIDGSLEFKQVVRWAEDRLGEIRAGADDYPNLADLGTAIGTAVLAAGVSQLMAPDVQKVELVTPAQKKVVEAPAVQAASKEFFGIAQRDPAIAKVEVSKKPGGASEYSVPREEFAERSGLWTIEQSEAESPAVRTVRATWTVILIKPAAVGQPRAWRFSRDGIEFSAVMEDPEFLAAIKDGRVPISLQEGVVMRIALKYRERLAGQVWEYVPSSRRVEKVITPAPNPARSARLTPTDE